MLSCVLNGGGGWYYTHAAAALQYSYASDHVHTRYIQLVLVDQPTMMEVEGLVGMMVRCNRRHTMPSRTEQEMSAHVRSFAVILPAMCQERSLGNDTLYTRKTTTGGIRQSQKTRRK